MAHVESKLQKFAVETGRSPASVLCRHPAHPLSDLDGQPVTVDVVIELNMTPATDFDGFIGEAVQGLEMRDGDARIVGECRYNVEAQRS